jgi:hypothetical protein
MTSFLIFLLFLVPVPITTLRLAQRQPCIILEKLFGSLLLSFILYVKLTYFGNFCEIDLFNLDILQVSV